MELWEETEESGLTDGREGSKMDKWQGISHIMAFHAPYRASPGQARLRSSGHRPLPIDHPLPRPAYPSVDVLKLKNNYTAVDTEGEQRPLLGALFVCLPLLATKVNMSMARAAVPNL